MLVAASQLWVFAAFLCIIWVLMLNQISLGFGLVGQTKQDIKYITFGSGKLLVAALYQWCQRKVP